jgi:hypothetical protein
MFDLHMFDMHLRKVERVWYADGLDHWGLYYWCGCRTYINRDGAHSHVVCKRHRY